MNPDSAGYRVRFGVLGALELHRGGTAVALPSSRQRAVLSALLANAGRPVSSDVLVGMAWADSLPANPRGALNTVLSRVRTAVAPATISRTPAGYQLDIVPEVIDAARFETLYDQARSASTHSAGDLFEAALQLWRGPAYGEFADRDAVTAEAVRLDEMRVQCIEDLAELHIRTDDAHAAVIALEPCVEQYPYRERLRKLLMTALYQVGRGTEALDNYRGYAHQLAEDMGLDPSPALRDLHERILTHDLAPPPMRVAVSSHQPRWLATDTAFVGRDDDMADLIEMVGQHRLVTVTGMAGVGKSRLAAETLPALGNTLSKPIQVIELIGVGAGGVAGAVATALDVGVGSADARDAVLDHLSVTPVLLVLDNCEHVLTETAELVRAALRRCPSLNVVATSRQRLGMAEEMVIALPPLATPVSAPGAEFTASVRLFLDRARRASPAFELSDPLVPAVAEICRRLDGLPLAIELAATRSASLGIEPLRQRLGDALRFLGDDHGGAHASLTTTLDWSYNLLHPSEQELLAVLAVFESGFDLDGAEAVANQLGIADVPLRLAHLVDASLVSARADGEAPWYRLLEIVRAYAHDRMLDKGVESDARFAHACWSRDVAERAAALADESRDADAVAVIDTYAPNLLAAIRWGWKSEHYDVADQIAGSLLLASVQCYQHRFDVIDMIRQMINEAQSSSHRPGPLASAAGAVAHTFQGELDRGEATAKVALATPDLGTDGRYLAMLALGVAALYRGDYPQSRRWWSQLLGVRDLPPRRNIHSHASLALVACYDGHLRDAIRHARRAEALADACGSSAGRAFAHYAAAEVSAAAEPAAVAIPRLRAAIREAENANITFVASVATTALFASLTREHRLGEALDVFTPLVDSLIRQAVWPQLWTALRIYSELLVLNDCLEDAAFIFAAADHAPSAPNIAGTDEERYAALRDELARRLDPEAQERVATLATSSPRTAVVEHARTIAADLRQRT